MVSCGGDDETVNSTLDPTESPTTIEIAGNTQQIPTVVATSTAIPTSTPLPTPTPPPRTTSIDYTVVSGDVLGLIAERYDISLSRLQEANPGVAAETLQVGQTLTIPPPDGTSSGDLALAVPTGTSEPRPTATPIVRLDRADGVAQQYVVVAGDRASNIAFAHSVSVDAIQGANGLVNVDSLWIGQCLIIPSKGSTTSGRIEPAEGLCPSGTASNDPAGATPVPTTLVTPAPTVDPNATATPVPTTDPNATPVPAATATPDPNATVTPTPDPNATVTPTPGPTAAATATPTVDPFATPTATPTVDPDAPDLTIYGDEYRLWDSATTDGQAFAIQCLADGGTLAGVFEEICDLPG